MTTRLWRESSTSQQRRRRQRHQQQLQEDLHHHQQQQQMPSTLTFHKRDDGRVSLPGASSRLVLRVKLGSASAIDPSYRSEDDIRAVSCRKLQDSSCTLLHSVLIQNALGVLSASAPVSPVSPVSSGSSAASASSSVFDDDEMVDASGEPLLTRTDSVMISSSSSTSDDWHDRLDGDTYDDARNAPSQNTASRRGGNVVGGMVGEQKDGDEEEENGDDDDDDNDVEEEVNDDDDDDDNEDSEVDASFDMDGCLEDSGVFANRSFLDEDGEDSSSSSSSSHHSRKHARTTPTVAAAAAPPSSPSSSVVAISGTLCSELDETLNFSPFEGGDEGFDDFIEGHDDLFALHRRRLSLQSPTEDPMGLSAPSAHHHQQQQPINDALLALPQASPLDDLVRSSSSSSSSSSKQSHQHHHHHQRQRQQQQHHRKRKSLCENDLPSHHQHQQQQHGVKPVAAGRKSVSPRRRCRSDAEASSMRSAIHCA